MRDKKKIISVIYNLLDEYKLKDKFNINILPHGDRIYFQNKETEFLIYEITLLEKFSLALAARNNIKGYYKRPIIKEYRVTDSQTSKRLGIFDTLEKATNFIITRLITDDFDIFENTTYSIENKEYCKKYIEDLLTKYGIKNQVTYTIRYDDVHHSFFESIHFMKFGDDLGYTIQEIGMYMINLTHNYRYEVIDISPPDLRFDDPDKEYYAVLEEFDKLEDAIKYTIKKMRYDLTLDDFEIFEGNLFKKRDNSDDEFVLDLIEKLEKNLDKDCMFYTVGYYAYLLDNLDILKYQVRNSETGRDLKDNNFYIIQLSDFFKLDKTSNWFLNIDNGEYTYKNKKKLNISVEVENRLKKFFNDTGMRQEYELRKEKKRKYYLREGNNFEKKFSDFMQHGFKKRKVKIEDELTEEEIKYVYEEVVSIIKNYYHFSSFPIPYIRTNYINYNNFTNDITIRFTNRDERDVDENEEIICKKVKELFNCDKVEIYKLEDHHLGFEGKCKIKLFDVKKDMVAPYVMLKNDFDVFED